jgi:hypothetical protein
MTPDCHRWFNSLSNESRAALDLGVPTYRFIRRCLERRPPVPLTMRQVAHSAAHALPRSHRFVS